MDYLSGPKSGDIVLLRDRRHREGGVRQQRKKQSLVAASEAGRLDFSISGAVRTCLPHLGRTSGFQSWGSRCLQFLAICHRSLRGPIQWPWSNPGTETPAAGLEIQNHTLLSTDRVKTSLGRLMGQGEERVATAALFLELL